MTDTSFSSTIELLISSGFRLGLAATWGQFQQDENLPYQIYVNPDNFTLVAIAGNANDGIDNLKMYFSWKPDDQINKDFIFSRLPAEYRYNTTNDYYVDDSIEKNPEYDEFSDVDCTAFASLQYKRCIGKTDNMSLFGYKSIFSSFSEVWDIYTLISTCCPFYPWKTSKYICLVTTLEEKMFTCTLPDDERKFTESDLRTLFDNHIRDQKQIQLRELTIQKLCKALVNLDLSLDQFGIK
jgi:hypothetical protein